mmetsp:Transcript_88387/g.205638  ORF Transcript_88387/g.205638 Transcript_88387/m.205638 type:complete len:382 (+) Transcript_88387:80-1225(+)
MSPCGRFRYCSYHAVFTLTSLFRGLALHQFSSAELEETSDSLDRAIGGLPVVHGGDPLRPQPLLGSLKARLLQRIAEAHITDERRYSPLHFWLFMGAIVIVVILALTCSVNYYNRFRRDAEDAASIAKSNHSASQKSRESPKSSRRSRSEEESSTTSVRHSSFTATSSEAGATDGLEPRPAGGGPGSRPLCPLLIVPEGTRLACVVQNDVCRKKQDLSFNIRGMQSRGGQALFQMRVAEHGSVSPGIHVETLGGKEQLAFLSTKELWMGGSHASLQAQVLLPTCSITRPWGEPFGVIQKRDSGDYVMMRGKSDMWVFSGEFSTHSFTVTSTNGSQSVAAVCPGSTEEYQVYVQAKIDAGLLVLGLLAIDKCELDPNPSLSR